MMPRANVHTTFRLFLPPHNPPLPQLSPAEVREMVSDYLDKEGVNVPVNYEASGAAAASISKRNGVLTLNIRPTVKLR